MRAVWIVPVLLLAVQPAQAQIRGRGGPDAGADLGTDGTVYALAVQPDQKILVGGQFTTLGGFARQSIGRLNADWTIDFAFNPEAGGQVDCLASRRTGRSWWAASSPK
jgi:hypothetical protein